MRLLIGVLTLVSLGLAVALVIIVLRHSACSEEIAVPRHKSEVSAEIRTLEQKALSGDRAAANRLAEIYMKISIIEERYWLEVGAENGDPVAQYNLADFILRKKERSEAERLRAIFWLKQSSTLGNEYAQDRLREESMLDGRK